VELLGGGIVLRDVSTLLTLPVAGVVVALGAGMAQTPSGALGRTELVPFPGWRDLGKGEDTRFILRQLPRRGLRVRGVKQVDYPGARTCHPDFGRIMRRHRKQFKYCYESQGLPDNPRLTGRVTTEILIWQSRVIRARVVSSSLLHGRTERCVLTRIRKLDFPGLGWWCPGELSIVYYPLFFTPKK
jgi:hypothetical protein